jgi:cephalosporin hydroxylase
MTKANPNSELRLLRSVVVILLVFLSSLGYYVVNLKDCNCAQPDSNTNNQPELIIKMNDIRPCAAAINDFLVDVFPESSVEINLLPEKLFRKQLCTYSDNYDEDCNLNYTHSVFADTLMGDAIIPTHHKSSLDIMKVTTIDQICHGYNLIFEKGTMFSYTNFLGVPLQQDPNDAFAIMDLIWRLKPDLMIELGTAGGGSAFFYAFIMKMYNKDAKVITVDPKRTEDWNKQYVNRVCPHCTYARQTKLWDSGTINFFNELPVDVVPKVETLIEQWGSKRVLVMEDGNHLTATVKENINAYAKFVTPGSFLIVQDTKMRRLYHDEFADPTAAVEEFLSAPGIGQEFFIDRTFEYYLCSQHTKGFLKRRVS